MNRSRLVLGAAVVAIVGAGVATGAVVADGSGDGSDGAAEGDGPRVVQPGAPGEESRELAEEDLADLDGPPHTDADVRFMQGMILHHRQALEMTGLVEERTGSADIPLLADRITISQEAEIELMEQWLDDRGEELPDEDAGHEQHNDGGLMPGMLTDGQLQELSRARGVAFDRLFLERMISHHQGALQMVDELYTAGGGLEPAADRFARDAAADQSIEIGRMQDLLAQQP